MAANGVVSGKSLIPRAPGFLKAPGGAPANVSIAVARLGGKASFIGKLGEDEFGRMLADILKQNGVSDDGILFDQGARTALAFVTLRADGEREFMFYRNPSADMLLKPEELNLDLIRSAKVFHYGSISLIVEPCRSAHMKAMEVAKEAGALLSYDPNLRLPLWPSADEARNQILSIWDKADIVKVSDVELEFLTGEKGSRYYTKKFHGAVNAFHVNTVDTTGAGDSFVGALLCKIVDDPTILRAITKTKKGAIPALPT
ncbi:Fructokinase-2 [Hibiscus syriacus]|uniref:Fructokinase-2 n=1 Tax=Hibiscus syriacus TaxID=106335 RepID=A0A6A2WSD6_HIBSY|nr:Fructokinase-2 [Hibiscus syriacus]